MKLFTYIKNNSSRIPKKNFQVLGGLELWKHLIFEMRDSIRKRQIICTFIGE